MTVAPQHQKIDDLMDKASESLARTAYFEAERMAVKALIMARQESDFERMARIILPLQEARRQRFQQALDVGTVTIMDVEITEDMKILPGTYLVQPPLVGADARRLRLSALHREVPVAVVCREPLTQLRLCPVVVIGPAGSLRARVDPPDDPEHPDVAWITMALEELGDVAIRSVDPEMAILRRVDATLDRLDALPEHEGLHQVLAEACREASRQAAEPKSSKRSSKNNAPSDANDAKA